jgi:hypothetical protein
MLTSLILMAAVMESPPAAHHQQAATAVVQIPVDQVVAAIANTDIEWGVGWCGLMPIRVRGGSHLIGLHWRREMLPFLVTALDDPNRCAAAHYLLACATRSRISNRSSWDGLEFSGRRDLAPIVDDKARRRLKEMWQKRLKKRAVADALTFPKNGGRAGGRA